MDELQRIIESGFLAAGLITVLIIAGIGSVICFQDWADDGFSIFSRRKGRRR